MLILAFEEIVQLPKHIFREDARGGAGGATATPIFQDLVKELSPKILKKKFPFIVGSPNFKFLTTSLLV